MYLYLFEKRKNMLDLEDTAAEVEKDIDNHILEVVDTKMARHF